MRLLYKPLSMIARSIASRLARSTFKGIWARIEEGDPPKPTAADSSLAKVVEAAALEAATMAAFTAAADRTAAHAFRYVFGVWPGGKRGES
jgi:hypothetical protein